MFKRIVSFIGWSLAAFFFVTALAGLTQPTPIIAIPMILWGVIFLPPVYRRFTRRYGWKKNVIGRLALFFIAPILIAPALPPSSTLQATTVKNTPVISSATAPSISPSPSSTPKASPAPTPSPLPSSTPTASPTPTPSPLPSSTPTASPAPSLSPSPLSHPIVNETKTANSSAQSSVLEKYNQSTEPEAPKPSQPVSQLNPLVETPPIQEPSNSEPVLQNTVNTIEAKAIGTPIRAATSGQGCDCPYDLDKRGNSCGKRSAYSRPSGRAPVCYIGD